MKLAEIAKSMFRFGAEGRGSFYDPVRDEACAFEELISFHGGLGGAQTRPFLLHPQHLPAPDGSILGAATVHQLLLGWRHSLQAEPAAFAH